MQHISVPLTPRISDGPLQVLIIGRISTENQNEENIEASYRYVEDYLKQIHAGPLCIKHLGECASGMLTDRASIREAEELIAAGKIDLVIAEDLSRIYRNPRHQYDFVQNAVDQETRVICLGDNLDTADENWEVMMGAAALRHGLFIPDTRRRVRRTATHAFHRGGMVTKVKFGYLKLTKQEAESARFGPKGLMIAKDPEATPTIRAMKDRYMRGSSYAGIAQWLQDEKVPPGPYVESQTWSGGRVKDLFGDPILSGRRTFRKTICKPIYKTGKHRQRKNANPETESYPELAHLSLEEHEELLREIARRSEEVLKVRSPNGGPRHVRHNVPRSRSIWPGQSATCAACGGLMYYMGKDLKCENALHGGPQTCWNHVQVPAELTRRRVLDWLMQYLNQFPCFRPELLDAAWDELQRIDRQRDQARNNAGRDVAALEKQAVNLAKAIAQGGELDALLGESRAVAEALRVARQQSNRSTGKTAVCGRFRSKEQIEPLLDESLNAVADSSFEFADLMRRIITEFVIQPVQALDPPLVRPRGKLTLRLSGLNDDCAARSSEEDDVHVILDLFEAPKHIRYLDQIVAAKRREPKLSLKKLAALLPDAISYMAVKRALDYARLMESAGVTDPYRELLEPPANASRWNRRRTGS